MSKDPESSPPEKPPRKKAGRKKGTTDFRGLPPGQIPVKDMKVLENRFVHGMTLYDAGKAAGLNCTTRSSFERSTTAIISRHKQKNAAFIEELQKVGVSPASIAERIAEGMSATVGVKVKNEDGKGSHIEQVPDFGTRHKYVETALDIFDGRAPKRVEVENLSFEQRLLQITMKTEG